MKAASDGQADDRGALRRAQYRRVQPGPGLAPRRRSQGVPGLPRGRRRPDHDDLVRRGAAVRPGSRRGRVVAEPSRPLRDHSALRMAAMRRLLVTVLALTAVGCVSSGDIDLLHREITDVSRQVENLGKQSTGKEDLKVMSQRLTDQNSQVLKSNADIQVELQQLRDQIESPAVEPRGHEPAPRGTDQRVGRGAGESATSLMAPPGAGEAPPVGPGASAAPAPPGRFCRQPALGARTALRLGATRTTCAATSTLRSRASVSTSAGTRAPTCRTTRCTGSVSATTRSGSSARPSTASPNCSTTTRRRTRPPRPC